LNEIRTLPASVGTNGPDPDGSEETAKSREQGDRKKEKGERKMRGRGNEGVKMRK
jgi:hypothetical protein